MKFHSAFITLAGIAVLAGPILAAPQGEATGHGSGAPVSSGPSPDAENAMKGFKYDQGLQVSLFASEPLLGNPVSFQTDEKGRWYIAESYRQEKGIEDNRAHSDWLDDDLASRTVEDRLAMMHKFYKDAQKFADKFTKYEERITRVEDSNGDGKADKTTIIADGFRDPLDGTGAGIMVRGNDVWWTCIPNLWHFKIGDGPDGKAETREKLLSGFGVHFALRGHDMHGLRFGPDGKLYFSIGDRGIHMTTKEGKTIASEDTGSIMRCNPDGSNFEVFATGVRNPQELAFDEHGNLFTGDNNSDVGDAARFHYLVEGGDCGWRTGFQYLADRGPWMRERPWDVNEAKKSKYINPPVANLANGPSGLTYNPGTGLSEKYDHRFYLSDFRGGASASVVHEIALEPAGAFFKLKERRDFVKGILTTDVEFGVDGSLYVLDWVESWGGVGKGRIFKFTDSAANKQLQEETRKLIEDGMTKRPEAELAKLLEHPDMRVRQAAQFELAGRDIAKSGPVFASVAKSSTNTLARIHAIWGLGELAEKNAQALNPLPPLLDDADMEVRAQAAHILGDHHFAGAADKITSLLKDKENRVRYFAAMGIYKLAHKPALDQVFSVLAENNDQDPILRHGCVMALTAIATPQQLVAKATDPSVAVRAGAVVALRRLKSPEIARFLEDGDSGIVLEAARAINDVPIEGAVPALAKLTAKKGLTDPNLLSRVVNANFRLGKAENAAALAAFAAEPSAPEAMRRDALKALMDWGNPGQRDRILNIFRPLPPRGANDAIAAISPTLPALIKNSPADVQEQVAKLVSKLSIPGAGDALFTLAANDKAASAARVAAIETLAQIKDSHLAQVASTAVTSKDAKVRTAGLKALANADPVAAVKAIGEIVNTASSTEKQGALIALEQIKNPEANALISTLMDHLIEKNAAAEIQLDILTAAQKANTPELKEKIKKYEASLSKDDDLAAYRIALKGGDVEHGRKIFREKAETQCLRCHKNEIGDSQVGPELTHIGSKKDREYILESIVYPNKKIAEGFETVLLTLKDNSMVVGRLTKEDASGLCVETMDDKGKPKTVTVTLAQIQKRDRAPSPMPDNMRDLLNKAELRDLVEYLATRK